MFLADIFEGVHDTYKHKAIFLAGGPGAGKSTLAKKLLTFRGFKHINSDRILELYAKKFNLDLKKVSDWRGQYIKDAKTKMAKLSKHYIGEGLPLLFDGTGANPDKIRESMDTIKEHGYDVAMIFFDIEPDLAARRNISRQMTVNPEIANQLWKKAKQSLYTYKEIFDNLIIYNGENLKEVDKKINTFLNKPVIMENYSTDKIYLHGGPRNLIGGHFKRGGRNNSDMGALFFIEESEVGYKYALGYAISRGSDTGIYRVKINIPDDKIFDFTNINHKKIAKDNLPPQEYQSWEESKGISGHLDWTKIDEELLAEWGFLGVMLHERSKGFYNYSQDALSVGIFDPKHVEIIDFIPKKDAIEKYGKS
jgi:predicted kinase